METKTELTRAEIMQMPPDELRQKMAELMGYELIKNDGIGGGSFWIGPNGEYPRLRDMAHLEDLPSFTADIGAADLVVSEMESRGYRVTVSAYPAQLTVKSCTMQKGKSRPFVATADTRAMAICRAALLAQKEQ